MSGTTGDVRKDFILATIANHFGLPVDLMSASLAASPKLNTFLDDGNATVLSANVDSSNGGGADRRVLLDNAAHVGHTDDKVLVFFKSVPGVVTPENLDTAVLVSSMLSQSPASALYHSLLKAGFIF